jgi:hypothetical protein
MSVSLPIAKNMNAKPAVSMLSNLVNRHGCITGATGTGKTVTLQVIAQSLSKIGVPVFMADVKGDLSGLAKAGAPNPKISERLRRWAWTSRSGPAARSPSGMSSASRAIRCGQPFPTSGRCCCRAC